MDGVVTSTIVLPYDSHPAFQFGAPVTKVDRAQVEAFGAAYDALARSTTVSPAERVRLEADARQALDRAFDDIARLEADPGYTAFVQELRAKCQTLLAADLAHFASQNDKLRWTGRVELVEALRTRAFYTGRLSAPALLALTALVRLPAARLRQRAAEGKVSRSDLSVNKGALTAAICEVLNVEFGRQGVNDVVSTYARKPMSVGGVALELSVPGATWWRNKYDLERAPSTVYVHTDESIDIPKSIVYLTDVDATTGPMAVYPHSEALLRLNPLQKLVGRVVGQVGASPKSSLFGTYKRAEPHQALSSELFRRHFSMLPVEIRYNSHFGWDVLPDSPLEAALAADQEPVTGPAGTFAVFDGGRLMHRGGLVEHGDRLALQVLFTDEERNFRPSARLGKKLAQARTQVAAQRRGAMKRFYKAAAPTARTVRRYSFLPEHRLRRDIAAILPELLCVDVGASYFPHPAWELFRTSKATTWVAVEPNEQNVAYLRDWPWPSRPQLVATGLSERGGEQILYVTNTDSGSSLMPPVIDANMAHRVTNRGYLFPVREKSIRTRSLLDVVREAPGVSSNAPVLVKLDTQGSELSILRGADELFAERRIVGIETEATLLAHPTMQGSGKFWQVCQFLESKGFELLQMKPIEGAPRPGHRRPIRTFLNECDAVFALTPEEIRRQTPAHQLALVGFYLSYRLLDEALALFETIPGIDDLCAAKRVSAVEIRRILRG
jgi:FkbM family methyltransferase